MTNQIKGADEKSKQSFLDQSQSEESKTTCNPTLPSALN